MAEEHLAQQREAEARRYAQQYLTSQNVPGYSAPADAPPAPAPPAPAPPPPGQPSTTGQSIKKGLVQGGAQVLGGILGGPVGYSAAKALTTEKPQIDKPTSGETYGPPSNLKSPEPVATTEDDPLILQPQGSGAQMVTPAGMYPQSNTVQVHQGRDVPQEAKRAFNAGTGYAVEGAEKQAAAERAYGSAVFNQTATRLRATEDAMAEHQRVQAERDQMVRTKLAEIEAFNAQAAAEIDPNKYWHDRGALAATLGIIGIGLGEAAKAYGVQGNAALQQIEAGINREVEAQWKNRQLAGQRAQHAQTLLGAHLDRLKDADKAIDATKLALWDNVAAHVDAAAAQRGIDMADANLLKMKEDIAFKRGEVLNKMGLQETDDVNKQATETWHNATYAGGAGQKPPSMEGYELIPVPASDQTSEKNKLIAVPKGSHQKLAEVVGATNTIININKDALQRIQEIDRDMALVKSGKDVVPATQRIVANRKTLNDLAQRKASYMSSAEGQGVLKEAEFDRAMSDRVHFNDYWTLGATVQKRIQAQNNGLAGAAGSMVRGAGGQEVRMAYSVDKNGYRQPTPIFTGKMYAPAPVSPEMDPVNAPPAKGK